MIHLKKQIFWLFLVNIQRKKISFFKLESNTRCKFWYKFITYDIIDKNDKLNFGVLNHYLT